MDHDVYKYQNIISYNHYVVLGCSLIYIKFPHKAGHKLIHCLVKVRSSRVLQFTDGVNSISLLHIPQACVFWRRYSSGENMCVRGGRALVKDNLEQACKH